jgi:hypothetical protein
MNTNVNHAERILNLSAPLSHQHLLATALNVGRYPPGFIPQLQSIIMPMVLLSEGQLQMLRMCRNGIAPAQVAYWFGKETQLELDRDFENLVDQSYKEDQKWEEGPREDLYLGC